MPLFSRLNALHQWMSHSWPGPGRREVVWPAHGLMKDTLCWRPQSTRAFIRSDLTAKEIGHILTPAISDHNGRRVYPSAGGFYGLSLLICRQSGGPLWQICLDGSVIPLDYGDIPAPGIEEALFNQFSGDPWIVSFVANMDNYIVRYGEASYRLVLLEAGHLMQELLREMANANLRGCPVGGYDNTAISQALGLGNQQLVVYMLALEKHAAKE